MMPDELVLSPTWIFDLDGTLVKHNGYKTGEDEFLPGSLDFLRSIPDGDFIIILTAREENSRAITESFLRAHNIRYNILLFAIPMGERILFNDSKPSGLKTAYAVECIRDKGLEGFQVRIDKDL